MKPALRALKGHRHKAPGFSRLQPGVEAPENPQALKGRRHQPGARAPRLRRQNCLPGPDPPCRLPAKQLPSPSLRRISCVWMELRKHLDLPAPFGAGHHGLSMKLWIGVTDNDWFRFLRSLSGVEEVNFWRPGGKGGFKALPPGGLFLFKLHYPENFIVGGGFFVHFTPLLYTLAWEVFGEIRPGDRVRRYRSGMRMRCSYDEGMHGSLLLLRSQPRLSLKTQHPGSLQRLTK